MNRPPHEIADLVERIVLDTLPRRASSRTLARAAGVSVFELNLAFRAARGLPLYTALLQLRLEAAERMLQAQPAPDPEAVAVHCGFGHYGVFHRAYRQRFDREPGGHGPAALLQGVAEAEPPSFVPKGDKA